MKKYECSKCGSKVFFTKDVGNSIGLYCKECGKWVKWLGKDEIRLFEQQKIEQSKSVSVKLNNKIQCAACGFVGEDNKWFNTNITGNYLCCPNCGTVRYVCPENRGFRK